MQSHHHVIVVSGTPKYNSGHCLESNLATMSAVTDNGVVGPAIALAGTPKVVSIRRRRIAGDPKCHLYVACAMEELAPVCC